jgi:hypothetical protein
MSDIVEQVRNLRRQQAAVAGFGSFALRQNNLLRVLTEAARVCAESLGVPFCKVCRYRPEDNDLLVEAGYGWHAGVVGKVALRADESTPQGRAFVTGKRRSVTTCAETTISICHPTTPSTGSFRPSMSSSEAMTARSACWKSTTTCSTITISTTSIFSPASRTS